MKFVNEFKFIKPSEKTLNNVKELGGWGPLKHHEQKFLNKWCGVNHFNNECLNSLQSRKLLHMIKSKEYDIRIFTYHMFENALEYGTMVKWRKSTVEKLMYDLKYEMFIYYVDDVRYRIQCILTKKIM